MSIKNILKTTDVSSLVLYPNMTYGGQGVQTYNGNAGFLAADAGVWTYQSVGITGMQLFVWTAYDTGTPGYSFTGHIESLLSTDEPDFPLLYEGATYPLQCIGIDPNAVAVLMVDVISTGTPQALAVSQNYPDTGLTMSTFAAPDISGALGFVSTLAGSSSYIGVQYGDYSASNGTVAWSGYGNLSVDWVAAAPIISGISGLPAGWTFSTPVKQSDGSWSVTLNTGAAKNTGVLYTGTNYSGSSKTLNPHVLTQLNSGIGWSYNSLKLTEMSALIYSSFAPTNTGYNYNNYQEQLLTTNTTSFASIFSGTTPVSLLSLDGSDVVVNLVVNTTDSTDSALVLTQSYPQTFYNFASTSRSGLLAVIPSSGEAKTISISYGSLDGNDRFTSFGSGTLSVALSGGVPVITADVNLPGNWNFSSPEQQADGSWRVSLNDQVVVSSLDLYPQINYGGTPLPLAEHDSVTLRTLANLWQYDSVRVGSLRWLSITLFNPQSTTYDYRQYRDSYSSVDVADISQDYPLASPLIAGTALGPDDVVVRVHLRPQDDTQKVVLSATQSWPTQSSTASVNVGGISHDGVLIVFNKTQVLRTIPVQIGVLNADGSAVWQQSSTVTARWDNSLLQPVVTLGNDAPGDWQLLGMQATAQEGEFTTVLSFNSQLNVQMYPITNAPAKGKLGGDESFTSYNKVALYCDYATSVNLSLSGGAKFKSNNLQTCTVALDAATVMTIEFWDQSVENVTVTLSGDYVETQTASVSFTNYNFTGNLRIAANNGAPNVSNVPNSVYFDTQNKSFDNVTVTLSGSAVFAGTNANSTSFPLKSHSYDCTFDVVNTVAETITVKAEVKGYSPITTGMTFVAANI